MTPAKKTKISHSKVRYFTFGLNLDKNKSKDKRTITDLNQDKRNYGNRFYFSKNRWSPTCQMLHRKLRGQISFPIGAFKSDIGWNLRKDLSAKMVKTHYDRRKKSMAHLQNHKRKTFKELGEIMGFPAYLFSTLNFQLSTFNLFF